MTSSRFVMVLDGVRAFPKQRPRLSHGKAYTPAKTQAYERLIALHARSVMSRWDLDTLDGDLGMVAWFYRADKRRVDTDNLVKALKDSINGIVYHDDSQVIAENIRLIRSDVDRIAVLILPVVEFDQLNQRHDQIVQQIFDSGTVE